MNKDEQMWEAIKIIEQYPILKWSKKMTRKLIKMRKENEFE